MKYGVGVDVGGSSVKGVAVTPAGEVLARRNESFDPERPRAFAESARTIVRRLQAKAGEALAFLGLSAPGLAAADGRSIAFLPGRLAGMEGLDWTQFLGAPFPVPVLNDAQAALLGEVWQGAAAGATQAFMLTLGTGVGGAAMVDGRLLRGAIGRAGHLGHISLNPDGPPDICNLPGSLELAVGNCTVRERSQGRFATTHELIQAVKAADPSARAVWERSVRALAVGIASLINVLDPEIVVIGGGIAGAGETLFGPLRRILQAVEWRPGGHRVRIEPAQLGEFAGALGAARNAQLQLEAG